MSFCSSTSTASFHSCPSFTEVSARYVGVHTFAGRLPRSRASVMPAAIALPSRMPRSKAAASRLDAAEIATCTSDVSSAFLLFMRSKR